MDIGELLLQAANLMLTGMIGVFVFLSILIFAVSRLALLAGDEEPQKQTKQQNKSRQASTGVSNAHIAAISAAIAQYRAK